MVHEFHRLLPTLVLEEDDGVVVDLIEAPVHMRGDPFFGSVDHLPQYVPARVKLEDLHIESRGPEAELELAAEFVAFASGVGRGG